MRSDSAHPSTLTTVTRILWARWTYVTSPAHFHLMAPWSDFSCISGCCAAIALTARGNHFASYVFTDAFIGKSLNLGSLVLARSTCSLFTELLPIHCFFHRRPKYTIHDKVAPVLIRTKSATKPTGTGKHTDIFTVFHKMEHFWNFQWTFTLRKLKLSHGTPHFNPCS